MATNRISQNTGSRYYLISSLLLVLSTVSILQAEKLSPLETGSGDGSPVVVDSCLGLCDGEAYECIEGSCTKKCMKDCSNEPYAPLCATALTSTAETFDNECELENSKCQNEDDQWLRIYDEACVTTPPHPVELCKRHQENSNKIPDSVYFDMCDTPTLEAKINSQTVQLSDFLDCYYPHCTSTGYLIRQCSFRKPEWCWCSDPDGVGAEDTLKFGLQEADCFLRNSCFDENGNEHKDASLFTPPNGCGLCECMDGVTTCFEEYVPSSMGTINDTQIQLLKDELTQLFYFQFNHNEHVMIDIRHIHQHPTIISQEKKRIAFEWKFDYYDRDGNMDLSPGERHLFKTDIQSFFLCSTFFEHVIELINDGDIDLNINLSEWGDFFGIIFMEISGSTMDLAKRQVQNANTGLDLAKRQVRSPQQLRLNRLEKRKRFLYTLE